MGNKPKTLHFHVFGCEAYVFLPIEIHANKFALYSELMIFIRYEDNGHFFMCHTQGNTIFCSIHAIFDEKLSSKCTNSHTKEHKLYEKLLDKTSLETESSVSDSSRKIDLFQYSFHTHLFLLSKTILPLVHLHPYSLISSFSPHLFQGLKTHSKDSKDK